MRYTLLSVGRHQILRILCYLGVLLAVVSLGHTARAQSVGDLLIAPTRLVFEGNTRTTTLTLLNIGKDTATYRISFIHLRMTDIGELLPIDKPEAGEMFADDIVRFTPRQVVLEPRVAQVVRLQLRLPANLANGEYRSHLLFRAIPVVEPATADDTAPATGIGIKITPIYGLSIPVIVRHGTKPATVAVTDLQLIPGEKAVDPMVLSLKLNREGDQSCYGNITVTFTPAGGKEEIVGRINGVAVYTPNTSRLVQIVLTPPEGVTLTGGRLTLTYQLKPEDGGDILAQVTKDLP